MTSAASCFRCLEARDAIAVEEHILAGAVELVSCRTDTSSIQLVVEEVLHGESFGLGGNASFAFSPATQSSLFPVALLVNDFAFQPQPQKPKRQHPS